MSEAIWIVRKLHAAALPDPHDEREVMHAGLMRKAAVEYEALVFELRQSMNVMDEVRVMLRNRGDSSHAAELAERIGAIKSLLSRTGV